jgi:hypothetical protein
MSGELEDREFTDRSLQPVGSNACRCEHGRRSGPLASVKPFTEAMPAGEVRIIEYPAEVRGMLAAPRDPGRAPGA